MPVKSEGVYSDNRCRWYLKVSLGKEPLSGRRVQLTRRGFRTATEAGKARHEVLSKVDAGLLRPSAGTLTTDNLLDLYLDGIDADEKLSAKTRRATTDHRVNDLHTGLAEGLLAHEAPGEGPFVMHVHGDDRVRPTSNEAVAKLEELASDAGAIWHTIPGDDDALVGLTSHHDITQIIIEANERSRLEALDRSSVVTRLLRFASATSSTATSSTATSSTATSSTATSSLGAIEQDDLRLVPGGRSPEIPAVVALDGDADRVALAQRAIDENLVGGPDATVALPLKSSALVVEARSSSRVCAT